MKVIFLDVDGVLNSDEYFEETKGLNLQGIYQDIDVEKIKLLKKAVDETGAKVVLTSSWRYTKNAIKLKELLKEYEIFVDATPFIENKRGLEIKKWLLDNQNVDDFVTLDDEIFDSFDEDLLEKLIKISDGNGYNFGEGLLEKDVDEILERFEIKRNFEMER